MNKLSDTQLARITYYIQQTSILPELQAELVDHVASLVEKRMEQGLDFSVAFEQVMQQANPQALVRLKELYIQETVVRSLSTTSVAARRRVRAKRRSLSQPIQYSMYGSVFAFIVLMGLLILISRSMSMSLAHSQLAWIMSGVGLTGVLLARWLLSPKIRKLKLLLAA